ncbi:uncharacterized protein N7506_001581 [Penicillium brevicompactum]|uniref:uncharacterized protein n=1 Tax=Penicillium brevicompactum TaxID=5074 RepID=UPI002540E737|nr:uncharacterized protein N7506_001581 [Penicillium brevicompactum]KAJ5348328.1 hypothetical protein N7506_001581 [Penicillium brevicompactum]
MGLFSRKSALKAERGPEAPEYNVRQAQREAMNQPTHFGPNFYQGPEQQEIFDRRQNGEVFEWDKDWSHPELINRAHSYDTTVEHKYSDPYVKRPAPWNTQMVAEREYYKDLGHGKHYRPLEADVKPGLKTYFGDKRKPTEKDREVNQTARAAATKGRNLANRAMQAREGFDHKYPQAYEDHAAIATHRKQIDQSRNTAKKFAKHSEKLHASSVRLEAQTIAWEQREARKNAKKSSGRG